MVNPIEWDNRFVNLFDDNVLLYEVVEPGVIKSTGQPYFFPAGSTTSALSGEDIPLVEFDYEPPPLGFHGITHPLEISERSQWEGHPESGRR